MEQRTQAEKHAAWLTSLIQDFIDHSPENTLQNPENEKAFAHPIVGFSQGHDPLYEEFKEYVGPFHWTPWEIFHLTFPDLTVQAEDLTVISWILPQTEATKKDNRQEIAYPAERWARARIFGEQVNNKLRQHVVESLQNQGHAAVAPMLSPHWETNATGRLGKASTWSERHAAYASGLGTFGLCDGLITPVGKAMRTGSVVAFIQVPAGSRPYTQHQEYCPFFSKGTCGICIARCPVGAITRGGHDKEKCATYLSPTTSEFVESHYGFQGYGCGLCQTSVPCESGIPVTV